MTRYLFLALLAVLTFNTGCKLIYRQNVQQGNAHEQEDLDQVTLGMTKKQVAYLLGTPAVQDPFHKDRWDYISMFSRRGGEPVRRLVTLTFENDLLVATDGIGSSTGGDIEALAETRSAVAEIQDVETVKQTHLVTDDAVINWTLQLGAFNTQEEAVAFAEKVRSSGFEAKLQEQIVPGLGTRHQVRSGQFDTYNEAQAQLRIMEKALKVAGITVPITTPLEP
jgi:outer membrane protein assembly factor BamE (lipoprotein component of BamABCDE complex)